GQFHALGVAGGAAGIELNGDVRAPHLDPWCSRLLAVAPRAVAGGAVGTAVEDNDLLQLGKAVLDAVHQGQVVPADKENLAVAVGEDIFHLGGRQPPVDGDYGGSRQGDAQGRLEVEVRVFVQQGDPGGDSHPCRGEAVCHLAAVAIEVGEGGVSSLVRGGNPQRAVSTVVGEDIPQGVGVLD